MLFFRCITVIAAAANAWCPLTHCTAVLEVFNCVLSGLVALLLLPAPFQESKCCLSCQVEWRNWRASSIPLHSYLQALPSEVVQSLWLRQAAETSHWSCVNAGVSFGSPERVTSVACGHASLHRTL